VLTVGAFNYITANSAGEINRGGTLLLFAVIAVLEPSARVAKRGQELSRMPQLGRLLKHAKGYGWTEYTEKEKEEIKEFGDFSLEGNSRRSSRAVDFPLLVHLGAVY
jgi:hypothetical protein